MTKYTRSTDSVKKPMPYTNSMVAFGMDVRAVTNTKNKKDMGTLNDQTTEKKETIKNARYKHVSTYKCQLVKKQGFPKIR